eukprot:jgi/Galph1/5634/GphlegSOOS_G4251.1
MDSCTITVKLFATAKEMVGRSSIELDIPVATQLKVLITDILPQRYPQLQDVLKCSQIAVNCKYVELNSDYLLQQRDEVAVIVPVSGG